MHVVQKSFPQLFYSAFFQHVNLIFQLNIAGNNHYISFLCLISSDDSSPFNIKWYKILNILLELLSKINNFKFKNDELIIIIINIIILFSLFPVSSNSEILAHLQICQTFENQSGIFALPCQEPWHNKIVTYSLSLY